MNTFQSVPSADLRAFDIPGGVYNATPPRIVFGPGQVATVADEVRRLGAAHALVVSTPGRSAMADDIRDRLATLCVGTLPEAVSQVPIELAERGRNVARDLGADCLVSIGGGASIGLAKGIALETGLPIINIPTTYSGSEMTGFCGITIDGVKVMHEDLRMLAATVIYDPELSLGLPLDASAASALNALAHCIDGAYVTSASPVHRLAAIEAARATVTGIRATWRDPASLAARSELLYGGYLAGAVLAGGFALQHGLAHTLGGSFDVPHGEAHAVVLPYVTAYNQSFATTQLNAIARVLGADTAAGAIHDLLRELRLPTRLEEVGLKREDLTRIVRITVETDNGLNPGPVTEEAVTGIVEAAFDGQRPR